MLHAIMNRKTNILQSQMVQRTKLYRTNVSSDTEQAANRRVLVLRRSFITWRVSEFKRLYLALTSCEFHCAERLYLEFVLFLPAERILMQGIKEGAVVKNIKNKDPIKFIHSEKKILNWTCFWMVFDYARLQTSSIFTHQTL